MRAPREGRLREDDRLGATTEERRRSRPRDECARVGTREFPKAERRSLRLLLDPRFFAPLSLVPSHRAWGRSCAARRVVGIIAVCDRRLSRGERHARPSSLCSEEEVTLTRPSPAPSSSRFAHTSRAHVTRPHPIRRSLARALCSRHGARVEEPPRIPHGAVPPVCLCPRGAGLRGIWRFGAQKAVFFVCARVGVRRRSFRCYQKFQNRALTGGRESAVCALPPAEEASNERREISMLPY